MINTFQKLRILQYNVYKLKRKMMIALLHKKRIKNYNILIIQKLWWYHQKTRMYSLCDIDFTLKNNERKICFYVNNCIDDNSWHSTWYFKNVKIITLQLRRQNEKNAQNSMNIRSDSIHVSCLMNIHEIYNFSSTNHNKISKKKIFCAETSAAHAERKHHYKRL